MGTILWLAAGLLTQSKPRGSIAATQSGSWPPISAAGESGKIGYEGGTAMGFGT